MIVNLQKTWIVLILTVSLYNIIVIRVSPAFDNILKKKGVYTLFLQNEITKLEDNLKPIKLLIPKGTSIGYISDQPNPPDDNFARNYYLLQYIFTPSFLTSINNNDIILAYFFKSHYHEPTINSLLQRNYHIIYSDANYFYLFKRSATK